MANQIKIPDELKADLPPSMWGKILSSTPVVMAVIATMLAGLSSSEMTTAQYERSLGAQRQSKAGDQWGYFQAKKLRSAMQHSTLDVLQSVGQSHSLDPATLSDQTPAVQSALIQGELPEAPVLALEPGVKAALEAIEKSRPEPEVALLLSSIKPVTLESALTSAKDRVLAYDALLKPINQAIEQAEKRLASPEFTAARLRYQASRYDSEARLNQSLANILELQVRQSNIAAERHHLRSGRFFYGMLASQMAVIIATLAIAARNRNFLWSVAAGAGVAATSFAVYVFLYV